MEWIVNQRAEVREGWQQTKKGGRKEIAPIKPIDRDTMALR